MTCLVFANDSLETWCCLSIIWKHICTVKTLTQDVRDPHLGVFYHVTDFSRSLCMNRLEGAGSELGWICRKMLNPAVSLNLSMLIQCDLFVQAYWTGKWGGNPKGSQEFFWSFGFQWSLKLLEAQLTLLSWDNSGFVLASWQKEVKKKRITRNMVKT